MSMISMKPTREVRGNKFIRMFRVQIMGNLKVRVVIIGISIREYRVLRKTSVMPLRGSRTLTRLCFRF